MQITPTKEVQLYSTFSTDPAIRGAMRLSMLLRNLMKGHRFEHGGHVYAMGDDGSLCMASSAIEEDCACVGVHWPVNELLVYLCAIPDADWMLATSPWLLEK